MGGVKGGSWECGDGAGGSEDDVMGKFGVRVGGDILAKIVLCHGERGGKFETKGGDSFVKMEDGIVGSGGRMEGVKWNVHFTLNGNIADMSGVSDGGSVAF